MRINRFNTNRRSRDFQAAKKSALLIAVVILFIIIGATWLGSSVSYKKRQGALPLPSNKIMAETPDKPKKTFFLKLYDYIAREQMEMHQSLDKI